MTTYTIPAHHTTETNLLKSTLFKRTLKEYSDGAVTMSFLPCDAMRCTVFVIVILSVCLSVCLSVTLVDCVHTVRPTIMVSSLYDSLIILVSRDITIIPKFEGGHPERGR